MVHCKEGTDSEINYDEIKALIPQLKKAGVFPHFNINLVQMDEAFSPEIVEKASRKFKIHKNRMFIGAIHHFHKFDYSELGGVRIIF